MKAAVFREVNQPMEVEEIDVAKPGLFEQRQRGSVIATCIFSTAPILAPCLWCSDTKALVWWSR